MSFLVFPKTLQTGPYSPNIRSLRVALSSVSPLISISRITSKAIALKFEGLGPKSNVRQNDRVVWPLKLAFRYKVVSTVLQTCWCSRQHLDLQRMWIDSLRFRK